VPMAGPGAPVSGLIQRAPAVGTEATDGHGSCAPFTGTVPGHPLLWTERKHDRSAWKDKLAVLIAAKLVLGSDVLALSWYDRKLGIAMAPSTPIIATTIMSSINVNPRCLCRRCLIVSSLCAGPGA